MKRFAQFLVLLFLFAHPSSQATETHELLHVFSPPPPGSGGSSEPGDTPTGGLVHDGAGFLWGVTVYGGAYQGGTAFKIDPETQEMTTVVHFVGGAFSPLGSHPSTLVCDGAGVLWGTTTTGGQYGKGTIFKINASTGELTQVVEFSGNEMPNKGAHPRGRLSQDGAGFFWGTTSAGGASHHGTVFKLEASTGKLTTVVEFTGIAGENPGSTPYSGLLNDDAGYLWGTTSIGGAANFGTIFIVELATGRYASVVQFTREEGPFKGEGPSAGLTKGDGNFLWGTTLFGGTWKAGTIYRIDARTGAFVTVVEFPPKYPGGGYLYGKELVADGTGYFWSAENRGEGNIYKVNTYTGKFTPLIEFTGRGEQRHAGSQLSGPLYLHTDGHFYGVTGGGGAWDRGTIFRIRREGVEPARKVMRNVLLTAGPRGAGSQVAGAIEGETYASVSTAVAAGREVAFSAKVLPSGADTSLPAILMGNPPQIVARAGEAAPGGGAATFKSFGDPLLSEAGVAFFAKLSDGRSGVWRTVDGQIALSAIVGGEAPGLSGTKIASIMSFSLRGEELLALLKLRPGHGGVVAGTDRVLVRWKGSEEPTLLLREGARILEDEVVRRISIFTPGRWTPGQGRHHAPGAFAATLGLGGRERVAVTKSDEEDEYCVLENSGPERWGIGSRRLGPPAVGAAGNGAVLARAWWLTGAEPQNDDIVWAQFIGATNAEMAIREGRLVEKDFSGAALPQPYRLGLLRDQVVNSAHIIACAANLGQPASAQKSEAALLIRYPDARGTRLVSRVGDAAPSVEGSDPLQRDVQIARFVSFALADPEPDDEHSRLFFVAKLRGPAVEKDKTDTALFGMVDGTLRCILRTGDVLQFEGQPKTVRSFTALNGGRPVGGHRAFSTARSIAVRAVFADLSTGIVQIDLP